jgi:hypothetical protein
MFLSSKNFEELNMLINIDNYRFVSNNKLEEVHEDIQKIMNLEDFENFYIKYENIFSSLCSFKVQLMITNYKLSNTILVIKFISKIKYRLKKKKLDLHNITT